MAALLDRSLADVASQRNGPRQQRRGASGGLHSTRIAPYTKGNDTSGGGESWQHDMFDSKSTSTGRRERRNPFEESGGDNDRASPKLRIENVHYDVAERELEALFAQIGPLASGPSIKFDKSGRSEGIAWVTFTTTEAATRAMSSFQGASAKGQPLKISYDFSRPKGMGTLGEGAGLLARLSGDSLTPRLSRNDRDRGDRDRPTRGSPRGGLTSSRGRGRGGGRGGAPRSAPKTEADLDAELESFMRNDPPAKNGSGDVQMAE